MDYQEVMQKLDNLSTRFYLLKALPQQFQQAFIHKLKSLHPQAEYLFFDEEDYASLLAESESYSFFGEGKIIVMADVHFFATKSDYNKEELQRLQTAMLQAEDTFFIFTPAEEKIDQRKPFTKFFLKEGELVEMNEWSESQFHAYITRQLQKEEYTLEPAAWRYLVNNLAFDIDRFQQELTKMKVYAYPQRVLTLACAQAVVTPSLEQHLFAISDHLLDRQVGAALAIYRQLLLQGEDIVKMNFMLLLQLRLLLQVKILQKEGYTKSQMKEALKIHPYRIELALRQSQKASLEKLIGMYQACVEAEAAIKSSVCPPELIFELLLSYL